MHEIPSQTLDERRATYEAEFDQLIERIQSYTVPGNESKDRLFEMIMAFSSGNPLTQVRGIAADISILERGLNDPELLPNAIEGLTLLERGPAFEGHLLMASTLAKNKDQVRSAICHPDVSTRQRAINLFIVSRNTPGNNDVWEIVEESVEVVAQDLLDENSVPATFTLAQILRAEESESTPNISDKVFATLVSKFELGEISELDLIDIMADLTRYDLIINNNKSYSAHLEGVLVKSRIGPISKFLDYWRREGEVQEEVELNLKTIAEIERERPGIVTVLHNEFGIRHFSRYSARALIAQYDSRDDMQTPYGIVVSAQRDWNGAFRANQHSKDFDKLNTDLNGNYLTRFIEVEDGLDLVRKMRRLNQRYGQGNKMAFVFLNAHSNEHLVELDKDKYVRVGDFSRGRGDILRSYLTPDAVVALIGCKSGKKGDFADQLAKKFGLKVIASKGLATKITIKVINDIPVDFKIVFHNGGTRRDSLGRANGGVVEYDYRSRLKPAV